MTNKERLIELLLESEPIKERDLDDGWGDNEISDIAEYLLENGVIVLPVKIGQTVYEIQQDRTLQKWYVYGIIKYDGQEWAAKAKNNKNKWNYIDKTFAFRLFGKTVFLTKEAAKKALKGDEELWQN